MTTATTLFVADPPELTPSQKWAKQRREYDRSKKGLLHRRYRDMKARVLGKPQYQDKWKGLELLPLEDFVRWSLYSVDSEYPGLWERWSTGTPIHQSGHFVTTINSSTQFVPHAITGTANVLLWLDEPFQTLLAPSIDRIDSTKGYFIGNMQWMTRSEHMKRSAAARINGRHRVKP